jgi:hypothetical protein
VRGKDARSALPAPSRARASAAPSVLIGDSLTVLLSLAKASAIALNYFMIVASRRSDRDPENCRPQRIIQCARCGAENKKSNGQDQQ